MRRYVLLPLGFRLTTNSLVVDSISGVKSASAVQETHRGVYPGCLSDHRNDPVSRSLGQEPWSLKNALGINEEMP